MAEYLKISLGKSNEVVNNPSITFDPKKGGKHAWNVQNMGEQKAGFAGG